jgi:hypothetical protein
MPNPLAVTAVWFAHIWWRDPNPVIGEMQDMMPILIPYDSYESALWALRVEAAEFWKANAFNPDQTFDRYSEQAIRETMQDAMGDSVMVEIRAADIINHTDTGWRSLNLKAQEDALNAQPPLPPHRFQTGLSSNNSVVRCVVAHNDKEYFGPWCGDEAAALKCALDLIPR